MNININITIDDRIVDSFKRIFRAKRSKIVLIVGLIAIPISIYAAAVTKPFSFSKGQIASSSELNANFDTLYALHNCPADMVEVGDFCVDKYEGSVWSTVTGGTQYGATADNYPSSFPDNGNWTSPLYARSVAGVKPSASITWFQAQQACINSGKHLTTNAEWQAAAAGTPDTSTGPQTGPACATNTSNTGPMTTGAGANCLSKYGAENMIGSLAEWTSDWWQAGTAYVNQAEGAINTTWPAAYGGDSTWNLGGRAFDGLGWQNGLPVTAARGGDWVTGSSAGVFSLDLSNAPTGSYTTVGFRCARTK